MPDIINEILRFVQENNNTITALSAFVALLAIIWAITQYGGRLLMHILANLYPAKIYIIEPTVSDGGLNLNIEFKVCIRPRRAFRIISLHIDNMSGATISLNPSMVKSLQQYSFSHQQPTSSFEMVAYARVLDEHEDKKGEDAKHKKQQFEQSFKRDATLHIEITDGWGRKINAPIFPKGR